MEGQDAFFFAFPKALDLAKENQDVILADCTIIQQNISYHFFILLVSLNIVFKMAYSPFSA
jgi:hypothetical protein